MTFARLWAAAPPGVLARPLRPAFHSLLVADGRMRHTVDFAIHDLSGGSALWVRPGQVQQFSEDRPDGELVLFEPEFLLPGTQAARIADDRAGAVAIDVLVANRASFDRYRRLLRREYTEFARGRVPLSSAHIETLRHLLSVLILSLRDPDGSPQDPAGLDGQFRDLLENDFAMAHNVDHYAASLGYSPRTLNRATQAAAGESPKQAINRRIALEARRLLAHTNRPVMTIARELGFDDPSNFAAFFTQQTRETPTGFRGRIIQGPGNGPT